MKGGREVVREEVNSVEEEKKGVVVVGLGELKELVKLMCLQGPVAGCQQGPDR